MVASVRDVFGLGSNAGRCPEGVRDPLKLRFAPCLGISMVISSSVLTSKVELALFYPRFVCAKSIQTRLTESFGEDK